MKKIYTTFRISLFTALLIIAFNISNAQFLSGNLVVEQVGDGSTSLSSAATTVRLLQFTPTGTAQTPTAFFGSAGTPASSPYNIVESGSATSNGYISLTTDKTAIVVPGYNGPNTQSSISSSASATFGRSIGKALPNGSIQTNGTFNALTGNNYRSVVSTGSAFWLTGGVGIVYTPTDATTGIATIPTTIFTTNTRLGLIFNNTLFVSTSSTAFNGSGSNIGIYLVGSFNTLPTALVAAGTAINIINTGTGSSPYGFTFSPNGLTCYIADDRTIALGGGIQKWSYSGSFSNITGWSGGSWSLAYTLGTGAASTVGARGLTVDFAGANPILYAITSDATLNRVIKITDIGGSSTATTLSTATTNFIYRGIAFAPEAPIVPLSLLSFNAKAQGNNIIVDWKSNNEINHKYYEVVYSTDGSNFIQAGQRNALVGSGEKVYTLTHQNASLLGSKLFYRLKMVSTTGVVTYSNIVIVRFGKQVQGITDVYPNPTTGIVTLITNTTEQVQLNLIDASGKIILSKQVFINNTYNLDLTKYANGIYILEATLTNGNKQQFKVVKK